MPNASLLIITNYTRKSRGGGIKSFVENFADNLTQCGRNFVLIGRFGEGFADNEKIIGGNRIVFILRAWLICLRTRPAIIHSHANWYCIAPALLYRLFKKVKIIHTLHSIPRHPYRGLSRLLFRWFLKKCDYLHFVSFFLRDYYRSYFLLPHIPCSVIYPGGDHGLTFVHTDDKISFRKKFSISDHSLIIVAQGLTSHHLKYLGADLLLDVFYKLTAEFENLILIFTKSGKYIRQLQKKTNMLQLSERVIFTQDLNNPMIANSVADIYAHITFGEGGISLALMEAMASGTPVVATRVGGIPELLKNNETGLLVDTKADDIYNAIRELIVNKQLGKSLGACARKHIVNEFRWSRTASQFIKIYDSL